MTDGSTLRIGDKVHYIPFEGADKSQYENGMLKSHHDTLTDSAFVVFNCAGEWDEFQNYTGQLTKFKQLEKGWV